MLTCCKAAGEAGQPLLQLWYELLRTELGCGLPMVPVADAQDCEPVCSASVHYEVVLQKPIKVRFRHTSAEGIDGYECLA